MANANLFNLRNRCPVFHVKAAELEDEEERSTVETEIILLSDFYSIVLADLGLKKFTDIADESAKIDKLLSEIGALTNFI